jgi:hypothetical protein
MLPKEEMLMVIKKQKQGSHLSNCLVWIQLGSQLMALFWKVVETLGGGSGWRKYISWAMPSKIPCHWTLSVPSLRPGCHDTNNFSPPCPSPTMFLPCCGPKAMEQDGHWLKPLKSYVSIFLSSSKLLFSGNLPQ